MHDLPNLSEAHLDLPDLRRLEPSRHSAHPPKILLLYGSLRERSYSRFLTLEAERLLLRFGAEARVYNPRGLPLPDAAPADHPKVAELRELSMWSEGQVWCSPERHGAISGAIKSQIDWLPLEIGGIRPTQGRTLAVMQVSGGSQSFNAVNALRVLGRWMRTVPNQSSVPKAYQEFDAAGRMRPSPLYDRVLDVMEELIKFTLSCVTGRTISSIATASARRPSPRMWVGTSAASPCATRRHRLPTTSIVDRSDRQRQELRAAGRRASARHHPDACLGVELLPSGHPG